MTPQQMATTWLNIWLEGAGIHGLHPAPGEPLLRWLLLLHERAVAEQEAATQGLSEHQAAVLDQLRHEIIATQRDTLPPEAQEAVRAGDIYAVRVAETAAIVWTLAALDAYASSNEVLTNWRAGIQEARRTAAELLGPRMVSPDQTAGHLPSTSPVLSASAAPDAGRP